MIVEKMDFPTLACRTGMVRFRTDPKNRKPENLVSCPVLAEGYQTMVKDLRENFWPKDYSFIRVDGAIYRLSEESNMPEWRALAVFDHLKEVKKNGGEKVLQTVQEQKTVIWGPDITFVEEVVPGRGVVVCILPLVDQKTPIRTHLYAYGI